MVGEHNRFIDNGVNQPLLSDLNSLFPTEFAYDCQHGCSVMIPNLLEPVLLTQRFQLTDQLLYKARVINLLQAESRALKFTITAKNSFKKT